jgi:two-component sensor histidine kinase
MTIECPPAFQIGAELARFEDLNPEGFVVLRADRDETGTVIDFIFDHANKSAHDLLGVSSLAGRTFQALSAGRADELFQHAMRRLEQGGSSNCQFERPDGQGGLWLAACAYKLDDNHVAVRLRNISDSKRSEARRQTVVQELEHRIRNLIAVVAGIVRATAKHEADVPSFVEHLNGRLSALAAVQSLILASHDRPVDFTRLVQATLAPFAMARFRVQGDPIDVPPSSAIPLALALHELTTNSLKYGGLSVPEGSVALVWRNRSGHAEIDWSESGGNPAQQMTAGGFGTNLINTSIRGLPKGMLIRRLEPHGLRVLMSFEAGGHTPD